MLCNYFFDHDLTRVLISGFCFALWGVMQFGRLDVRDYASTLLMCERLLFAICPTIVPSLITWGAFATLGGEAAPVVLMASYCLCFFCCCTPVTSSFKKARPSAAAEDRHDTIVCGRLEAAVTGQLVAPKKF